MLARPCFSKFVFDEPLVSGHQDIVRAMPPLFDGADEFLFFSEQELPTGYQPGFGPFPLPMSKFSVEKFISSIPNEIRSRAFVVGRWVDKRGRLTEETWEIYNNKNKWIRCIRVSLIGNTFAFVEGTYQRQPFIQKVILSQSIALLDIYFDGTNLFGKRDMLVLKYLSPDYSQVKHVMHKQQEIIQLLLEIVQLYKNVRTGINLIDSMDKQVVLSLKDVIEFKNYLLLRGNEISVSKHGTKFQDLTNMSWFQWLKIC